MKTFKTIDNRPYVATVTAEATVTDKSTGLVLAKATEAGQITFLAIGEKTDISDDRAVVVPASFSGASAGSAAGGGGGVDAVQVARMIADSDGVVHELYESVTQSPPEGNLDNYNAYGWAMVVTQSGRLDTVVLQPRSQGTVLDTFPVYLNIFALEGNAWKLLGCSENGVEQSLDTPSVWSFSGVELVAGQKLHVEGSRQKGSEARDARLSVRVVANTLADTGIIERNGDVRVTDWVPQYTLSLSRPAGLEARGVALAEVASLEAHAGDTVKHITASEREAWNAKADPGDSVHATQLIDPSNGNPVFVTASDGLGYLAPPASGAVCLSLTEGGQLGAPFVLVTSPSGEACMEPHQLRMLYGSVVFRLGGDNGRITCGLSQKDAPQEYVMETLEAMIQAPERVTHHADDAVKHVTAAERTTWNGMLPLSGGRVNGKVDVYDTTTNYGVRFSGGGVQWFSATDEGYGIPWDMLIAHPNDNIAHITAAERVAWNGAADSLNTHEQNAGLHLQVADSWSCMFFPGTGSASVTAGVFAGANTSWLSARSDAVTFSANDDGFVYKINTSGVITELRLGEAELQALATLIARKEELLALLPTV